MTACHCGCIKLGRLLTMGDLEGAFLNSGTTSPSASMKDTGQKKSTSGCPDNQEVDRWKWILHLNFTGTCKKNILLAFLFSFMALSSGFNEDVVVDGTWIKDEPAVFTAVGYTHDGSISDKVVIKMQKEIVHHGGIYACVLSSGKLQNVNTCQVPKLEELHSTRGTTAPMCVRMTNEGTRLVAFKALLVATVSLIIYGNF